MFINHLTCSSGSLAYERHTEGAVYRGQQVCGDGRHTDWQPAQIQPQTGVAGLEKQPPAGMLVQWQQTLLGFKNYDVYMLFRKYYHVYWRSQFCCCEEKKLTV